MGSLNSVTLIGRLGRDAEMRYTQAGAAVATLNLATSETWKDKVTGEKKEATEWHRVVTFGKTAETLAEYLTKGKEVCVVGKLQTRSWEKDGVKRYTTEIKADNIVLLGGGNGKPSAGADAGAGDDLGAGPDDDPIPF